MHKDAVCLINVMFLNSIDFNIDPINVVTDIKLHW